MACEFCEHTKKELSEMRAEIKEILTLLQNQKLNQAVLSFRKQKPLKIPQKKKCPQCQIMFEGRDSKKCCSRSCARKYFYATHTITYTSQKINVNGQYQLNINEEK